MLVHILQHVLNANLLAVSYTPYRIELQAFNDSTLEYKYSRGTRATDEVSTIRIKFGDGEREDTVMMAVQQSDTVGANECRAIFLTGVEDVLFECCTSLRLLAETGRNNDERPDAFFSTKVVDIIGTILRCHHEDSEVCLRNVLHIMKGFDALDVVLFGVDDTEFTLIVSVNQISYDGATGLVDIVGAADNDDALRLE